MLYMFNICSSYEKGARVCIGTCRRHNVGHSVWWSCRLAMGRVYSSIVDNCHWHLVVVDMPMPLSNMLV